METKFNFKSQICTSLEQSERLLSLGLKKETADMAYLWYGRAEDDSPLLMDNPSLVYQGIMTTHDLPAWSLGRLVEMAFNSLNDADADAEDEIYFIRQKNPFESMLELFEWLIKEGYFNKEYLV